MAPLVFDTLIRIQFSSWDACHRLMITAFMESRGTGLTNPALEVTAMLHHTGRRGGGYQVKFPAWNRIFSEVLPDFSQSLEITSRTAT